MNLSSITTRKKNYASQKIGGEYVIVPLRNNVAEMNVLINLNEVGSFIWDNLNEDSTFESLKNAIVAEFEVSEPVANNDLSNFLAKLDNALKV